MAKTPRWATRSVAEAKRMLQTLRNVGARFDCYPLNRWESDTMLLVTW